LSVNAFFKIGAHGRARINQLSGKPPKNVPTIGDDTTERDNLRGEQERAFAKVIWLLHAVSKMQGLFRGETLEIRVPSRQTTQFLHTVRRDFVSLFARRPFPFCLFPFAFSLVGNAYS
jgi:hypothetical protein